MAQKTVNESVNQRINFLKERLGFPNNRQFALKIPYDDSQLGKVIKAELPVSLELALLLKERFNVNIHWLFTGEGTWNGIPESAPNSEMSDPWVLENLEQLLSNQVESLGLIQKIQKRIKQAQSESQGSKTQDSIQDLIGRGRSSGTDKQSNR